MRFLTLLISVGWLFVANAEEVVRSSAGAASFPTKQGVYIHKQWKYEYIIEKPGTRSEKRIGKLFLEGKEIKGDVGELLQENFGHFIYFGAAGYNQGWLNTLTYDRPVFSDDGGVSEAARPLLVSKRENKQ